MSNSSDHPKHDSLGFGRHLGTVPPGPALLGFRSALVAVPSALLFLPKEIMASFVAVTSLAFQPLP